MTIKAIETRYKGYRFRSRLEARWAVFFDALGVKYKYEEYGFEKDGYSWLPDFYLPQFGTWVEVKGGNTTQQDAKKMGAILDFGSPLPFFSDSWKGGVISHNEEFIEMGGDRTFTYGTCPGLLLLGEIPQITHGVVIHSMITHHKGLVRNGAIFYGLGNLRRLEHGEIKTFGLFCGQDLENIFNGSDFVMNDFVGDSASPKDFEALSVPIETKMAYKNVCKAYQKARAARFEHGEQG